MRYYPVLLDIAGKIAVVVGGGPVAARKAIGLLESGARVTVIAPEVVEEIQELIDAGVVEHVARPYKNGDLAGAAIVVAATDSPAVNREAAAEAGRTGIPVNCAAPPRSGNFIVPSSVYRSGLTVSISTDGISPAFSKKLRISIEEFIDKGYGPVLDFLSYARDQLKIRVPDTKVRSAILSELVNSDLIDMFLDDPYSALPAGMERLEAAINARV